MLARKLNFQACNSANWCCPYPLTAPQFTPLYFGNPAVFKKCLPPWGGGYTEPWGLNSKPLEQLDASVSVSSAYASMIELEDEQWLASNTSLAFLMLICTRLPPTTTGGARRPAPAPAHGVTGAGRGHLFLLPGSRHLSDTGPLYPVEHREAVQLGYSGHERCVRMEVLSDESEETAFC